MRTAAVRIAGWVRRLAWARLCAAEARRREEERQRRALQVIWKVVVPWLARRALRFKKRRLAVLRGMIRFKGYARRQATRQDHWWDLAGERALVVAGESYRAAKEAASELFWRTCPRLPRCQVRTASSCRNCAGSDSPSCSTWGRCRTRSPGHTVGMSQHRRAAEAQA